MIVTFQEHLFDTVKEWEEKIGYRREDIRLYYPEESLLELFHTDKSRLAEAIRDFQQNMCPILGQVDIEETENGRYCVKVPAKGVEYIHTNVPENSFLRAFLDVVTGKGTRLEDVAELFYRFSEHVGIQKAAEREWGFWFEDGDPDPYVYHVEEDEFGLEYHRFTREAYRKLL